MYVLWACRASILRLFVSVEANRQTDSYYLAETVNPNNAWVVDLGGHSGRGEGTMHVHCGTTYTGLGIEPCHEGLEDPTVGLGIKLSFPEFTSHLGYPFKSCSCRALAYY